MKLNRLSLAVLLAAPFVANAGVTITPLAGFHSYDNATNQRFATSPHETPNNWTSEQGAAAYNDVAFGGAIGLELTPTLSLEAEYIDTQTKASTRPSGQGGSAPVQTRYDAHQQEYSGNFLIGNESFSTDKLKSYVLVGAGRSYIYEKPIAVGADRTDRLKTNDTIANLGLGAMYRINNHIALRGEGRAVRNLDHDWWEGMALAGLQITLGNHLEAVAVAAPAVLEPVTPEVVPVEPPKVAPIDSDNDGVIDAEDKCPNTPANVVVDSTGCAKPVPAVVAKELRVFFDTNKSAVKAQFKPEIKKAADVLNQNSDAKAKLEGHTDSTGPRSLNDRLSLARANAVKNVMVKEYGVASNRLTTEGFADTRPVAPNTTAEGRAMNRRVYAVISNK